MQQVAIKSIEKSQKMTLMDFGNTIRCKLLNWKRMIIVWFKTYNN